MPKKRILPQTPDPDTEVIALSPNSLTSLQQFACEVCGKTFARRQNLQIHLHGHNRSSKKQRQEEAEDQEAEEEQEGEAEELLLPRDEEDEQQQQQQDDDEEQESSQQLWRRQDEERPQQWRQQLPGLEELRKRLYICPVPSCLHHAPSWAFSNIPILRRHFYRKHCEKRWKCSHCSKEYAIEADCKAHAKTCGIIDHHHLCDCGVSFSRKDDFIAHRTFCNGLPAAGSSSLSSDVSAALPLQHRESSWCHTMLERKIVVICQFGGEFIEENDGYMSYSGGEAHAIEVDRNMKFDDFKSEIAEMWNHDINIWSIKYFLPSNKRTLITISNDKDLQRMVDFHKGLATADVYILIGGTTPRHASNTGNNRVARTVSMSTVAELVNSGPPPVVAVYDVGQQGSTTSSHESIITRMGQEFNHMQDFRDALRKYASLKSFVVEFIKNERCRVTAKCKAPGCPWRIHASKSVKTQRVRVRKLTNVHTCTGIVKENEQILATRQWVVNTIKNMLRDNLQYKTIDIVSDLYRDYGVSLKYHQARRGKDLAKEELQGSHLESYNQLPWYCQRIKELNPGSHVTLTKIDDSGFRHLFISFQALVFGFEHGCRPLLFLDGTPLKYKGTLLAAASVDGDDGIFPIAFAVVDAEAYDNWHWFLVELKSAISMTSTITIISDRNKGLKEAVPQVFPNSHHGYCLHHLIEDLKTELKGMWLQPVKDDMVNDLKRAAYACNQTDFNLCMENMRKVSEDVASWVLSTKPNHWSNAFFQGSRYDHFSSRVAELFKNWISQERDTSIVKMVDTVQSKMAEMISARSEVASTWSTALTPSMEQKLQKEVFSSCPFNVIFSSNGMFEVRDDTLNMVNIETWECSCRRWQIMGLPCIHALAVFKHVGRSMYGYCSGYFTVGCYRLAYSKSINSIPDVHCSSAEDPNVTPTPRSPRPNLTDQPFSIPEPKKKQAVESQSGNWPRQVYCSWCKAAGHNRATCKELEQ